jgi:hypothetical protein
MAARKPNLHTAVMTAILVLISAGVGFAGETSASRDYRQYCARCHGAEGKGNGPEAKTIVGYQPADLTRLSANNGGKFPRQEVYDTIDGGRRVPGHHDWNSPMPLWGMHFQLPGKEYSPQSEAEVRRRISALVDYIESMQVR